MSRFEKFANLPLRLGVGIVVLNRDNEVFVAKRIDNPKNYWQMPQGGVDEGENFYDAALRELEEETSIKNVTLIKEIEGYISYNLPDYLLGIIWKGKYKGQNQKWYIVRFDGKDKEINVNTKKPEFFEWKWIDAQGKRKQKYLVEYPSSELFAFAGLYDNWMNMLTGEIMTTCSIVTTEAIGIMREIHNSKYRMPITLNEFQQKKWLSKNEIDFFSDFKPHKF